MMTKKVTSAQIIYPYTHPKGTISYVALTNKYMLAAKQTAQEKSLDKTTPTGTVLVSDGKIIGKGANGSTYHETHGCERVRLGIPTGESYELCEGCGPHNHSEPKAIEFARKHGHDTVGAEAYLWGHWWCCEPCWTAMIDNGITTMHLLEDSEVLFNKPRLRP